MAQYIIFHNFTPLQVAIVGGGFNGLVAAVALRRSGHLVEIYQPESHVQVGASVFCLTENTREWLCEWDVDLSDMKPIASMNLTMHESETGKKHEGDVSSVFHLRDMYTALLKAALSGEGKGTPCKLFIDHICDGVDAAAGSISFKNGATVSADLILGAEGIPAGLGIPSMNQSVQPWFKEKACILGDAAPPMTLQLQGTYQSIKNAAALGIIFSNKYNFTKNVKAGLELYQTVRRYELTTVTEYDLRTRIAQVAKFRSRNGVQLSLLSNRLGNDRILFGMII
ncbi:2-polyprenyl-6-methoxyphenol hydroxylase [Mycena maculata]|uniref:2-polyprenyl-6-methoxyphenol hydroxylase n=1 Tax=Mycena maculata TaxID=230809 RepID=A0AAD7JYF1_9AGAR|nr:2-polyprenyl-6-methoxyphenol hydroxylase [Mycena maculata]